MSASVEKDPGRNMNDLRVRKTIAAIRGAFRELVLERSQDELSVKEVCERALVNKKTFYRYYRGLPDLFAEAADEMSRTYFERVQGLRLPEDLKEINRAFFLHAEEQGAYFERLVCHPDYEVHASKLLQGLVRGAWSQSPFFAQMSTERQNVLVSFLFATGSGLYRQWVADGRSIPIEEMIEMSGELLTRGVEGFAALGARKS